MNGLHQKIRLSWKLVAIGIVALVSVAIPTLNRLATERAQLNQLENELAGINPVRSLLELMLKTQQLRGTSMLVLGGDEKAISTFSELQDGQVSSVLHSLKNESLFQNQPALMSELDAVSRTLERLASRVRARDIAPSEAFHDYSAVVSTVVTTIDDVVQESHLGMYADPEVLLMVDVVATKFPMLIELLAQNRGDGAYLLSSGSRDDTLGGRIVFRQQLIRDQVTLIGHVFDRVFGLRPDLKGLLGNDVQQLMDAVMAAEQLVKEKLFVPGSTDGARYFQSFTQAIQQVAALHLETLDTLAGDIRHQKNLTQDKFWNLLIFSLVMVVILIVLLFWVWRTTVKALQMANLAARAVSSGDLDFAIKIEGDADSSRLLRVLSEMMDQLKKRLTTERAAAEEMRREANENARIRVALDNVSSSVMIADNDLNIIYMNHTVRNLMRQAESDIRKSLPNFSSDNLLGSNIDQFHKNPSHQRKMLQSLTSVHKAAIELGGRHFSLEVCPVMTSQGERLGSAVQWLDRTAEHYAEQEVAQLVEGAARGDFSHRVSCNGKTGFFLKLATDLNLLVETADAGLKEVSRILSALAKGDLSLRITADYQGTFGELRDYSNETCESLTRMVSQIREGIDTIHVAATEIATGNSDLSSRTEQQASSLEETASSMEELTSTVRQNADNARQANALAVSASEVATEGGKVVNQVVTTMSSINESARKIADIIGVIDGIAFQTNILALNAAVEAARAGEQGRGFAVVAGEVRTLAQRSAAAAKEIKTLISDSVDKVDKGNVLVSKAGSTMNEIVTAIKRVTDIMAEIAAASAEQSTGIEEVNGAVTQMDEMTQQNAALVEEAAASAESLQGQSRLLAEAVAVFRISAGGSSERSSSAALAAPKPKSAASASRPPLPKPVSASKASKGAKSAVSTAKTSGQEADEWEEF